MGTKLEPGQFDCYENALPDEPMFVLLARDPWAPHFVDDWAKIRERAINGGDRPESDRAMVREARECSAKMVAWRKANNGKWRQP